MITFAPHITVKKFRRALIEIPDAMLIADFSPACRAILISAKYSVRNFNKFSSSDTHAKKHRRYRKHDYAFAHSEYTRPDLTTVP
jgi:hypothetical protein